MGTATATAMGTAMATATRSRPVPPRAPLRPLRTSSIPPGGPGPAGHPQLCRAGTDSSGLRAPGTRPDSETKAVNLPQIRRGGEPVFVDRTGRRRRLIAVAGSTGGLLLTVALVALVMGLTGVGPVAVPEWPDSAAGQVRKARPTPRPSREPRSATTPRPRTAERTAARGTPGGTTGEVPAVTPTPAASLS